MPNFISRNEPESYDPHYTTMRPEAYETENRLSILLGRLTALPHLRRNLLLASHTRRLERLTTTRLRYDALVLNSAGETAQHRLETLTLSILYLYQLKSSLLLSQPDRSKLPTNQVSPIKSALPFRWYHLTINPHDLQHTFRTTPNPFPTAPTSDHVPKPLSTRTTAAQYASPS